MWDEHGIYYALVVSDRHDVGLALCSLHVLLLPAHLAVPPNLSVAVTIHPHERDNTMGAFERARGNFSQFRL